MVRPSRSDRFVAIKVYYRDQKGVMRAIPNLFLTVHDGSSGSIVYTNARNFTSESIDLNEKF
jgi:hypothetical protein